MTGSEAPVQEGETLAGKYRVEKVLGMGGMGVVVAATHVTLRQKVAIKFLLPGANQEVVERFLREARSAVRLRSDHVARVIDVGELDTGAPFLVMEYLDGDDLSAIVRKRGALPVAEAVDYVLQACEAIGEAHTAGIIHRDLKPANLFLTKAPDGSPTIKVLDFGISKDTGGGDGIEDEHGLTKTTAVLGSPHYMAPEQMRSTRSVDARADIWSLGVILYQLLTKTVPYKAESFMELALKVMQEDAPAPMSRRAELPPGLDAAILRCLRRDREERFANVSELAIAIAQFGGPDAVRSAERTARTQGFEPRSVRRLELLAPVPAPNGEPLADANARPAAGQSVPPVAATLESARAGTANRPSASTPPPPSLSAPPPASPSLPPVAEVSTSHGKTASTWSASDGGRPPPSASRFWLIGAASGMAVGALVAALVWLPTLHRKGEATAVAPLEAASALEAPKPVPVTPSAPAPAPSPSPPADEGAVAAPPEAPSASAAPSAEPSDAKSASKKEQAARTAAPHAPATTTAAPEAPPKPPSEKPQPPKKKNVLDIDIQ